LVRLVRLANGTVVVDGALRAAGRGAYVCPEGECLERGLGRGRLSHAFRKPSEAGPNLAAAVRAAARSEAPGTLVYEASAGAIEDVDAITVRS
jgi:hypothetical protein